MNSQRTVSSITNVKDSKGNPVDNGESTDDPLLTVYGGGTASSVVFVYDNGDLLTTASVTIDDGTWDFTDTFELGRHAFTVRDTLAGVDSPEWVVTVGVAAVRPTIEAVVDSAGVPVPDDSSTSDPSVILSGTAEPDAVIEIDDEGASWGTTLAPNGLWTKTLTGLQPGRHVFVAKAVISQATSAPWVITYVFERLIIDTSPAILNGVLYHAWTAPPFPPAGTYVDRPASGGVPPYSYMSANPAIATVDERGRVISAGNGITTITVTDSAGSTATFTAIVSNVYQLFGAGLRTNHTSASYAVRDMGGYLPSIAEYRLFRAAYGDEAGQLTPLNCWTRDQAPGPDLTNCWSFVPSTGQEQLIPWQSPGDAFGIAGRL
ncbi:hypothetical protein [Pseudomonas folii]|uniref:BIG2 domain-containing protein n=1 Tax=Pseudomonas folii TaxID=2762593 RepID=A0ABR7B1B0_9PSED|nr:hypothetical protein [Pseudomonas folii]MBC3950976.1 hypothetical protein [Pseudomonas folii]